MFQHHDVQSRALISPPTDRLLRAAVDGFSPTPTKVYLPAEGSPPSETYTTLLRRVPVGVGQYGVGVAAFWPYRMAISDWSAFVAAAGAVALGGGKINCWTDALNQAVAATTAPLGPGGGGCDLDDEFGVALTERISSSSVLGAITSQSQVAAGVRIRLVHANVRAKFIGTSLTNAGLPMFVPVRNSGGLMQGLGTGKVVLTYGDLCNQEGVEEFELKDDGWHEFAWTPSATEHLDYPAGLAVDPAWYADADLRVTAPGALEGTFDGDDEPLYYPTLWLDDKNDGTGLRVFPLGRAIDFMPFMVVISNSTPDLAQWVVEVVARFERTGFGLQASESRPSDGPGLSALMAHTSQPTTSIYTPPGRADDHHEILRSHVATALAAPSRIIDTIGSVAKSVSEASGPVIGFVNKAKDHLEAVEAAGMTLAASLL